MSESEKARVRARVRARERERAYGLFMGGTGGTSFKRLRMTIN